MERIGEEERRRYERRGEDRRGQEKRRGEDMRGEERIEEHVECDSKYDHCRSS